MQLFKVGENLAEDFPGSILIEHDKLDGASKRIVDFIKDQMWLSAAGIVGYPSLGKLTAKMSQPGLAIAGCMSVHIFLTKFCQQLLLKRLSKGKMTKELPFEEILQKYTHLIVDLKGNVLLVKEPKKGFLKRYLRNFYLVRTRIKEPNLAKSKTFEAMRKMQRKFWPGKPQLRRLANRMAKK